MHLRILQISAEDFFLAIGACNLVFNLFVGLFKQKQWICVPKGGSMCAEWQTDDLQNTGGRNANMNSSLLDLF